MEARAQHRAEAFAAVSDEAVKNPEYAIDCTDVSYGYSPDALVLEGNNLKIRRGEALALVGRSGSGKTTLARLIGGSLTALDGTITVMGRPVGHGDFRPMPPPTAARACWSAPRKRTSSLGTLADNFYGGHAGCNHRADARGTGRYRCLLVARNLPQGHGHRRQRRGFAS